MPLHTLPVEIIRIIAETFRPEEAYQLAGLIRTDRRFNAITARYLYTDDSIRMAFKYAARRDKVDCFLKAVTEKATRPGGEGGKPTPLTLINSCIHGSLNVVQKIIQMFPEMLVQVWDGDGRRPLAIAAGAGRLELVEWLLTLPQVRPDETDRYGKTPLIWACHSGRLNVVNRLLSLPNVDINHVSFNGRTPLAAALGYNQVEVMRTILNDNRFNIRLVSQNLLLESVQADQIEAFNLLLSYYETESFIRDCWGYDALSDAFFFDRVDMVKAFIEDTTIDINTTTVGEYEERFVDPILWVLLKFQQPVSTKLFKLIFEFSNLDVNIRCSTDNMISPLIYTIQENKNSQARLLIQHKCNLNEQDGDGYTALMWAIMSDNIPMDKLLLKRGGIDLSIRDNSGMPALCHATAGRRYDIMGLLLNHSRIDVNIRNRDGLTPLMFAVKHRRYVMSHMLIDSGGIDYSIPDNDGKTVVDYANRSRSWKKFAILIRAGQRNRRLPRCSRS